MEAPPTDGGGGGRSISSASASALRRAGGTLRKLSVEALLSSPRSLRTRSPSRAKPGGRGGQSSGSLAQLRAALESVHLGPAARAGDELADVLNELLEAEATYLADLRLALAEYGAPLRDTLGRGQFTSDLPFFTRLQQLADIHAKLEVNLMPARALLADADHTAAELEVLIGAAYAPLAGFMFMLYATYAQMFARAPSALADARRRSRAVDSFLSAQAAKRGPGLEALLLRPVQHLCRYPRIFGRVLECSGADDGSFRSCHAAVAEAIERLDEAVGELEAEAYTRHALTVEIASASPLLEVPTRRLLAQVDVQMRREDGGGWLGPQWSPLLALRWRLRRRCAFRWYLFNDSLLICRPSKLGQQQRTALLPLGSLSLTPMLTPATSAHASSAAASAADAAEAEDGAGVTGSTRAEAQEALHLKVGGGQGAHTHSYMVWASSESGSSLLSRVHKLQAELREGGGGHELGQQALARAQAQGRAELEFLEMMRRDFQASMLRMQDILQRTGVMLDGLSTPVSPGLSDSGSSVHPDRTRGTPQAASSPRSPPRAVEIPDSLEDV